MTKKKILIYGINYSPELTGIGKYTGEMGAWLATQGHQVDVITAPPYYPEWRIQSEYKNKWWHTEIRDRVRVHRCPLYVPTKVNGAKRIFHEFSFGCSSSVYWFFKLFKHYDTIFTPYPPLIIGVWPWLYRIFHPSTRWIFHIQDLQVDAAKELGLIKNKFVLSLFERVEKFWLSQATIVSSISEGMKRRILLKGISENKYHMLPNWADTEFIRPLSKAESLRSRLSIPLERKVVLYSGNLGEKQGVEILPEVAQLLPEYLFLLAGEGASKERLTQVIQDKKLTNVRFVPLQAYKDLPSFLATADVHLVLQKKSAADLVLPSKFITLLAAGATTVVTAEPNTTLYDIIYKEKVAYLCPPEDPGTLASYIDAAMRQEDPMIPKRARAYAEVNVEKNALLQQLPLGE
ncbi:MAG: WcaI family glycosyltransferase [Cytophagaceae bacterium]|nr:WcaI family glycosyltransferase [Cytophagaceae bacterium]